MFRKIAVFIIFALIVSLGTASADTMLGAKVWVSPSSQVGTNITVNVNIDSGNDTLQAAHVELDYDASALTATGFTPGTLLGTAILAEPRTPSVTSGKVTYGAARTGGNPAAQVNGTFFTVQFQIKNKHGVSNLNVTKVILKKGITQVNIAGQITPSGYIYSPSYPPLPDPAQLANISEEEKARQRQQVSAENILDPNSLRYIGNPKSPYYGVKIAPVPDRSDFVRKNKAVSNQTPDQTADHTYWGTSLNLDSTIIGATARQQIVPDLSLPFNSTTGTTLYAPTLMAPLSPIESVTEYYRPALGDTTFRYWIAWDHNRTQNNTAVAIPIDASFLNNYVRTYPEGQAYITYVDIVNDNWSAYLMNFNTEQWDLKYSCCGNVTYSYYGIGWNMWETYFYDTCPIIPQIQSSNLYLYTTNYGWVNADPSRATLINGLNWACTSRFYNTNMISTYNIWTVASTGTCAGDLNHDHQINFTDFTMFSAAYGTKIGDPNYNSVADFDHDGDVDFADFSYFASVYGTNC